LSCVWLDEMYMGVMRKGESTMKLAAWKYFSVALAMVLALGAGITVLMPGPVIAADPLQQWVSWYAGMGGSSGSEASAIALDSSGNVYVTGRSENTITHYDDYATVKYRSGDGHEEWVQRYSGDGGANLVTGIVVDGSGNVFVTGQSDNLTNPGYPDYATVKYRSGDGHEEWVMRDLNGSAEAIAVDGSGNIYVTGISNHGATGWDYRTIKYLGTNGHLEWAQWYTGSDGNYDRAYAIALDGSGNVYVTGISENETTGRYDYATVKYLGTNGHEEWVQRYIGNVQFPNKTAIAVDGDGNVYITGHSVNGANRDYVTIKYLGTNGHEEWVKGYGMPGEDSVPADIAVDGSGNAYVTGYSELGGKSDYATVKYLGTNGHEEWVQRYNGPANENDEASAIAVDGSGNAYVTGYSTNNGGDREYTTLKYSTGGVQQWVMRYGLASHSDQAEAIGVDGSGNVYVTGYHSSDNQYVTIKYAQQAQALAQAPTITAVNPASGLWGQNLQVIITGTNFNGATAVSFGTGITVNSFTMNSATQITANISITPGSAPGARDVSVTTPGVTATLTGGFTVISQSQTGSGSHSSSGAATSTLTPTIIPVAITVQSATLSTKSVTPGTPVTVTADIANKGTVNGSKKVTLYVNGQVESTQGVTVSSGSSSKLTFNVSRSEPGDYNVYVDGVPAGSFKVEMVTGNDGILIFSVALIAIAFVFGLVMLRRRQRTG